MLPENHFNPTTARARRQAPKARGAGIQNASKLLAHKVSSSHQASSADEKDRRDDNAPQREPRILGLPLASAVVSAK